MSLRGKGRVGAVLTIVCTLLGLFGYPNIPLVIVAIFGTLSGITLIIVVANATIAEAGKSRNHLGSLMEVELERARRQKLQEKEQNGGPKR